MSVCFHENITIKIFDENGYYPLKIRKCKNFDGLGDFSIFWNQLLIFIHNNKIYDKKTLCKKFNQKFLTFYKNEILKRILYILNIFSELDLITLYYNKYIIHNDTKFKTNLLKLYVLIYDL